MKEHAWHLPSTTTKHYQWFRNLADFHALTLAWLKELQVPRAPHLLTRGQSPQVTENLWMLDSLSDTKIDMLMDDTSPDDVLGRLDHTVWTVQAWTLINLLERTPEPERPALMNVLDLTSWRVGRKLAEERWKDLPARTRDDLRVILYALADSPFCGTSGEGFLIKRAVPNEIEVELHACPHRIPHPEVVKVADTLCKLHSQWIRGFAYALNTRVSIEDRITEPRCLQRWSFANAR